MEPFIEECKNLSGNHVNLIKFIRENCKNCEFKVAKHVIASENMDEKVKFYVLSACFDSQEGRQFILESENLAENVLEMILSEKIQKMSKEEILNVLKKVKSEEFKLKIIKKLSKHSKSTEIADSLLTGNDFVLSRLQILEALKFASNEIFVKNLSNFESKFIPWEKLVIFCGDKLLAYYESEFMNCKWYEYSKKWKSINFDLSKACHETFAFEDATFKALKSEFLIGLMKLYEKFPPFICDSAKEFSGKTLNYSDNLKIEPFNECFLMKKPKDDYLEILDHFKSPEAWLKKPLQEYFVQSYVNILFNWELKSFEKQELLEKILNELSDINETDYEKVSNDRLKSECFKGVFKRILEDPQNLNLKEFSLILSKIQNLIEISFEKLRNFKKSKDRNLFTEPLEISYLQKVMTKNFTCFTGFIEAFFNVIGAKFYENIVRNPKNIRNIEKLVEIIGKSMNLLYFYFENLHQESIAEEKGLFYQISLINAVKSIAKVKKTALKMFYLFELPLIHFENQIEREFYVNNEITRNLVTLIEKELIKKDFFSDWIGTWYKTCLLYLENSLSLSNVPSPYETDVFEIFKAHLIDLSSSLPIEKLKETIMNPTFEFLKRLDTFEFVHSKSKRFCSEVFNDFEIIQSLLSSAAFKYIFYNENLDEIFNGHLIISTVKDNDKPVKYFSNDKILKAFTATFAGHTKLIERNIKMSEELIYDENYSEDDSEVGDENYFLKKPNYLTMFSCNLLKKVSEKFKFLLKIENYTENNDFINFKNTLDKLMGFSFVFCREIISEFSNEEIEEIIERSANESSSVFENLFLLKLPLGSEIVKTFVNKKIARMESLEEKVAFYDKLYKAALEQNYYELCESDNLLALSSFIQPKIARVDWKAKKLSHPLSPKLLIKAYLSSDSPRGFTTPEHVQSVIKHLKIVFENFWDIDPRSYSSEVNKFCEAINTRYECKFYKAIHVKAYTEIVPDLTHTECSFEALELWEDFLFDLEYTANVRTKGAEAAQTCMIKNSIYMDYTLYSSTIFCVKNHEKEMIFKQKIFELYEAKIQKLAEKYYQNVTFSLEDGKVLFNEFLLSAIVNHSNQMEVYTQRSIEALDMIYDYCSKNIDININNNMFLSVFRFIFVDFDLKSSLYLQNCDSKKWPDVLLARKKESPHLFTDKKNTIEFIKKFIKFHEDFAQIYSRRNFPIKSFYAAKYFIYQCEEPGKLRKEFDIEFIKSVINICPSFLRYDRMICKILMENDPIYLLEIVEENDPRLLSQGLFISKTLDTFVIPFKTGNLSKNLNASEIIRLKEYFMRNLLNFDLDLNCRTSSAKWLANCLLGLDEIFPELFSKLSTDSTCGKELKKMFLKKLYNSPETELDKVLKICFSEIILNDCDAIVNVFSGLASKYSGNEFYDAIFPYIDPSKSENKELFTKKLNFSSQKAFAQLISTLDDGKVLLEVWKRRDDYKEHFNTLILKNIIKILTESKTTEKANLFLEAVTEAAKTGSVEFIKEILSVKPSKLLIDPIVREEAENSEGFVNKKIALEYADIAQSSVLEQGVLNSDSKLQEALVSYCKSWYGFEEFISDRHLTAIVKLVDEVKIDSESKIELVNQIYRFFPIYSKFLSKKSRKDIDPYSHLHSHFKRLLSEIESVNSTVDFETSISNLRKLNLIAEINKTNGKFDLTCFSTKNAVSMIKYYQLAASLYENMSSKHK